jgi:hypothetical protein
MRTTRRPAAAVSAKNLVELDHQVDDRTNGSRFSRKPTAVRFASSSSTCDWLV